MDQIRKAIAAEIRAAVARAGLSDAQAAMLSGISRTTFSRIARGKRPVSVEELLTIGSATGADLLSLVPQKKKTAPTRRNG